MTVKLWLNTFHWKWSDQMQFFFSPGKRLSNGGRCHLALQTTWPVNKRPYPLLLHRTRVFWKCMGWSFTEGHNSWLTLVGDVCMNYTCHKAVIGRTIGSLYLCSLVRYLLFYVDINLTCAKDKALTRCLFLLYWLTGPHGTHTVEKQKSVSRVIHNALNAGWKQNKNWLDNSQTAHLKLVFLQAKMLVINYISIKLFF